MDHLVQNLQKFNIRFKIYPHYAKYFRKRWEDAFVGHLTTAEKEGIYLYSDRYACGYLWHVFSWEKINHIKGLEANTAFDAQPKSKCLCFHQRLTDILVIENAAQIKTEHLSEEEDVYIVDEHFTWTYVVPHGGDIGPYFYSSK